MNSRIDELLVMFFLAERKDEVPVACKMLIVFKMNEFIFFHDDDFFGIINNEIKRVDLYYPIKMQK